VADHVRGRGLRRGVFYESLVYEFQYLGLPSADGHIKLFLDEAGVLPGL